MAPPLLPSFLYRSLWPCNPVVLSHSDLYDMGVCKWDASRGLSKASVLLHVPLLFFHGHSRANLLEDERDMEVRRVD